MENASKALLIAAAVLIVILLVAFGMKIFQSSSDVDADDISNTLNTATTQGSDIIYEQINEAQGIKSYEKYNNKTYSALDSVKDEAMTIFSECKKYDETFKAKVIGKNSSNEPKTYSTRVC